MEPAPCLGLWQKVAAIDLQRRVIVAQELGTELGTLLEAGIQRWSAVIKAANIKAD